MIRLLSLSRRVTWQQQTERKLLINLRTLRVLQNIHAKKWLRTRSLWSLQHFQFVFLESVKSHPNIQAKNETLWPDKFTRIYAIIETWYFIYITTRPPHELLSYILWFVESHIVLTSSFMAPVYILKHITFLSIPLKTIRLMGNSSRLEPLVIIAIRPDSARF